MSSNHQPDDYLTEKDISKLTKMSLSYLRNSRHFGHGPPYRKIGKAVRYKLSEVIDFIDSNKVEPQSQP